MKRIYFLLTILLTFQFVACKKEGSITNSSKHQLLTNGSSKSWLTTESLINGASIMPFVDSCNLDNLQVFKDNGSMHTDHGEIKCNTEEEQIEGLGTWLFLGENKLVTHRYESDSIYSDTVTILQLTQSSLKVAGSNDGDTFELHLEAQ